MLADGSRVWKDSVRVKAYGAVDELNALLGWCRAVADGEVAERILAIQGDLLAMGAQLAVPPSSAKAAAAPQVSPDHCRRLEQWIDQAAARAPKLSRFILPGGCELAARLHLGRTCCRRAERQVVSLHRLEPVARDVIAYLNRLGDLLFAWSRQVNQEANCPDVVWVPQDAAASRGSDTAPQQRDDP